MPVQMFRVPEDSAHDFYKLGSKFLKAAQIIFEKDDNFPELDFPGYALVGQAIELFLKAYLVSKGQKVNELKSIGHNLKLALKLLKNMAYRKFSLLKQVSEKLWKISPLFIKAKIFIINIKEAGHCHCTDGRLILQEDYLKNYLDFVNSSARPR